MVNEFDANNNRSEDLYGKLEDVLATTLGDEEGSTQSNSPQTSPTLPNLSSEPTAKQGPILQVERARLTQSLLQKGLRKEQITQIVKSSQGIKSLKALESYFAAPPLILKIDTLVQIVSHRGGSKNLDALFSAYADNARAMGFTTEQLIQVVSHDGGSKNLAALASGSARVALQLDFTHAQLIQVVSHIGGSHNFAALVSDSAKVALQLKFTHEQLIQIVSQDGGSKNLITLAKVGGQLKAAGFSMEQILSIASYRANSANLLKLAAVVEHSSSTSQLNFEHLTSIAKKGIYGRELLERAITNSGRASSHELDPNNNAPSELEQLTQSLLQQEITQEQINLILKNTKGLKSLKALKKYLAAPTLSLSINTLVRIVSHSGGAKNLAALLSEDAKVAEGLGFSLEELTQVVNHIGGANNLIALAKVGGQLKNAGFSREQILSIASRPSSGPNLRKLAEVVKNPGSPNELDFEQLTRLAKQGKIGRELLEKAITNPERSSAFLGPKKRGRETDDSEIPASKRQNTSSHTQQPSCITYSFFNAFENNRGNPRIPQKQIEVSNLGPFENEIPCHMLRPAQAAQFSWNVQQLEPLQHQPYVSHARELAISQHPDTFFNIPNQESISEIQTNKLDDNDDLLNSDLFENDDFCKFLGDRAKG